LLAPFTAAFATLAPLATFDVLRTQFGVAVGTIVARATTIAALPAIRTIAATIIALLAIKPLWACATVRTVAAALRTLVVAAFVALPPRLARLLCNSAVGRRGRSRFANHRGRGGAFGRRNRHGRSRSARRAARLRIALRTWPALTLPLRAARPPDLDEFRLGCRRRDSRRTFAGISGWLSG
jgi:hypothetical protein